MKTLKVNVLHWQRECFDLAKARAYFTVEGVSEEDRLFCRNVAYIFKYCVMDTSRGIYCIPMEKMTLEHA